MQVRFQPDRSTVLTRTVPMAKATQLDDSAPWQVASDSQVKQWLQSDSAIGLWLVSKGLQQPTSAFDTPDVLHPARMPSLLSLRP